jgi:hypothetical protein
MLEFLLSDGLCFPQEKEKQEMEKTQTYSMEKILAVREVLRNLPVKEKEKSRVEVVGFLKADLRKAVKQGHSLKEVQAILTEQGISVPLSSLEAVLGKSGKDVVRKKMGAGQSAPKERKADAPKNETVKPETQNPIPEKKEQRKMPSYYTPDLPDDQL